MCKILTTTIGATKMKAIRQFFNSILEAIDQARQARLSHNGK